LRDISTEKRKLLNR